MRRSSPIIMLLAMILIGCGSPPSPSGSTSTVQATDVTRPMIGQWGVDGEVCLIIKMDGNEIVLASPKNDAWRIDITNAKIVDNTIHFVEKHYLHNNDYHPFSGVACNSIIKTVSDNELEFGTTTVHSPEFESDILTRITP